MVANWDQGSLGSGMHPTAAPGMTAGESDSIYFDGSTVGGNRSCTWDYKPTNALSDLYFRNGWTQTVTFLDKDGVSVSHYASVFSNSAPTFTPNGDSGANAVAAITLMNGTVFNVNGGSSLYLTGYSSGNAIFLAGDGTAGEYLSNGGTVVYTGHSSGVDYLKVPVLNSNTGVFKVNGNGNSTSGALGAALQVSGSDATYTKGVSFYQDTSGAETDIYGNGTLWCYNDFRMDNGLLQTTDANLDILKVGTASVDGTVTLLGGTVKINPGTNVYGKLQILGTTDTNLPILNVGSVVLNFKISMTARSNDCDWLIVGKIGGTGRVNFGSNGGNTVVAVAAQGPGTTGHQWPIIYFGSRDGDVMLQPTTGYNKNWSHPNYLEIDTTS